MKIFAEYDPADKEAWLAIREQGLGGSDAGAIMGADTWRSPYDVWHDRIYPKRESASNTGGEAAYWGTVLERIVAQEFAERKSVEWSSDGCETRVGVSEVYAVYQHPRVPCMLATVDRLVYANYEVPPRGLLEVKTRSAFVQREWEQGVPEKVWWQVQHYLAVTELPEAWVAVLIGGQRYQDYYVPRDENAIRELEVKCQELWSLVESQTPPPITGSKETAARLDAVEPTPGAEVELPGGMQQDIALRGALKQYVKTYEHKLEDVEARIKAALGEAEYGLIDGRRVATWKQSTRTSIDTRELRRVYPEITAKFETKTTYRTLRVRGAEDE